MLWLQDKTRRSHSPHISCARNGSPSVQLWVRQLPSLRQTTYNTSPVRSHFTSDCIERQTNYLQHKPSSLPLYLRLHNTPDKLPTTLVQIAPTYLRLHNTPDKLPTTLVQIAPTYLRLHRTPDKLPTTQAQFAPTLPQTA